MHLVPLVFYAAAAAAYLSHFAWRDPRTGRLATAILGGGILAHTFLIGMQTVQAGHAPLVGTTAAISAFVWLLGLSYLYVELTTDERAMGVFVAPLLVALDIIPALDPTVSPRPPVLQSPLFTLHIVSLLFAYASFALAFVLGLTYVLLFKEIKARHLGFFYARLPSLQALDAMNGRVVAIGWLFLTLGIAVGALWATQVHASADPRVQAMGIRDPKILVALICWAVYSFALFARRAIGWSGRRAAWLSAIAFVIVLLNFVPVGYFFTKSHNF
jgi:ABC-type transport system involved in cytochrome c biogenesis permease subunit